MVNLEALTKNSPFRVVITREDGSESSIACMSRASAEREAARRRAKLGFPTRRGEPRSTNVEIRELA